MYRYNFAIRARADVVANGERVNRPKKIRGANDLANRNVLRGFVEHPYDGRFNDNSGLCRWAAIYHCRGCRSGGGRRNG